KSKVKGIDQDPKANQEIYEKYTAAFRKGVFNMIREDVDRFSRESIPRKYFSGGDMAMGMVYDRAGTVIKVGDNTETRHRWDSVVGNSDRVITVIKSGSTVDNNLDVVTLKNGTTAKLQDVLEVMFNLQELSQQPKLYKILMDKLSESSSSTFLRSWEYTSSDFDDDLAKAQELLYAWDPKVASEPNLDMEAVLSYLNNSEAPWERLASYMPRHQMPAVMRKFFPNMFKDKESIEVTPAMLRTLQDGKDVAIQRRAIANLINPDEAPYSVEFDLYMRGMIDAQGNIESLVRSVILSLPQTGDKEKRLQVPCWDNLETTIVRLKNDTYIDAIELLRNMRKLYKLMNQDQISMSILAQKARYPDYNITHARGKKFLRGYGLIKKGSPSQGTINVILSSEINRGYDGWGMESPLYPYHTSGRTSNTDKAGTVTLVKNIVDQSDKGGIDFATANLDMQIKRDGNGVVLPVSQQNLDNVHIDGLVPIILDIQPASVS
ncbi:MAG: hypothetical protein WCI27_06200, partial [Candidatus Omnitrophota bacterium]